MEPDFVQFAARKADRARAAEIGHLATEDDRTTGRNLTPMGNVWTRSYFGGDFWLSPERGDLPATSLVFVQSREGNTGSDNPADLGGGDTDLHLIYEGLSRVAADGVLAGARTVGGSVFFSVWHPELVALRESLGLTRHPTQVVMSASGRLDFDGARLFNVPDVPVVLLAGPRCLELAGRHLAARPWMSAIELDERDPAAAFRELRSRDLKRISCVGGRTIATALLDASLVGDLYLTTTEHSAGQPGTPFYTGRREPSLDLVLRKRSVDTDMPPIVFEHFAVQP